MTWTSPPTVATGDLYTAAMFNTYTRDNPNHLRLLTGNGDPAAASRVLVSNSAGTSVSWTTVPDAAMTNQKVNQITPLYTTFAAALAANSAFVQVENASPNVSDGPIVGGTSYYVMQIRYYNLGIDYRVQVAFYLFDPTNSWIRGVVGGVPSAWAKLWNGANDSSASGLSADDLRGLVPGNASGNLAYSNATMCTNLVAQYLVAYTAGNTAGTIPINNGVLSVTLNADQVDSHHAVDITPNNARVWFSTVAELTTAGAHWSRDTATDGRLLVGGDEEGNDAGLAVFTPGSNYGSHWFPMTGLTVNAGTLAATPVLDVGGTLDSAPNSVFVQGGGGGATTSHSHGISNLTVTGTVTLSGSPALSGVGTAWLPLMRAGVWGKKS